jgi:hypothetical protein
LLDTRLCAALPGADGEASRAAAALTVLALAAGPGRAAALWRDGAWREFLGLAPAFGVTDFTAALAAVDGAAPRPPRYLPSDRRTPGAARADVRALLDDEIGPALPPRWRAVFVRCALLAWRRAARRITGMGDASIGYLRANFIAPRGEARQVSSGRWRWRLARPPLFVLLNLSGLARIERRWSSPPRRSITLEFD